MSRSTDLREHESPPRESATRSPEPRNVYTLRDRSCRLSESDVRALKIVGAFRAVDAKDMPTVNLDRLVRTGLVKRRRVHLARGGEAREVLSLTEGGHSQLCSMQETADAQRYWSGIVKPNELEHDLAIYRAFQKEAEDIENAGGRVRRVVLDYEFKSDINRCMNRAQGGEKQQRRAELAEEYQLPIHNNKLALPDLRIEYTDANGREDHRDIEVVTRHYRGAHRAGKAQSGFRLHNSNSPRAAVRDDHHLSFL